MEELRSELERRMKEITQLHLEQRHLQADLAVKDAFIIELLPTNERAAQLPMSQGDVARAQEQLHAIINSAGFRLVSKVTRSLSEYPRIYKMVQRVVRRVAGK